jgi:phosphopantetheinyl transferase (holo-ACP synthase)
MSGETNREVSGWSVDTLKEYIEQRFTDSDKAVQAALLAAKEAVLKAEVASEKRFESVNEFRGQLADQTNSLIPRAEADSRFNAIAEKVTALTDRINITDGRKAGSEVTIGKIYAAIGVVGVILGILVVVTNAIFK